MFAHQIAFEHCTTAACTAFGNELCRDILSPGSSKFRLSFCFSIWMISLKNHIFILSLCHSSAKHKKSVSLRQDILILHHGARNLNVSQAALWNRPPFVRHFVQLARPL